MKKSMSSFLKRILAVALALFMVFTSMPLPVVTYATESGEEEKNNKALTIQVTGKTSESDINASALTGATVTYTVASSEDEAKEGGVWEKLTEDQGNTGIFTLPESSVPTTVDKNVYIKVIHANYEEKIVEIACTSLANDREPETIEMVLLSGAEKKINATVLLTIVDEVTDGVPEAIEVKYIISNLENIPEDNAGWITETCSDSANDTTATISLVDVDVTDGCLWVKITGDKYVTESFAIELSELEGDYPKEVRLNQFVNVGISISDSTKAEVVIGDEIVAFDENRKSIIIPKSTDENSISYKIRPVDKYYVKSITFGDEEPISFSPGEDIYDGNFSAATDISMIIEMGEYYTVSVTEKTEGGSVKLNDNEVDSIVADGNEDVTLKIQATEGYQISEVKIGDETVSRDQIANPLEYEKVIDTKEDTEISVTFVKVYTVNISYKGKGNVEAEPDIVFAEVDGKQVGSVTLDIGTNMSVDISATQDETEEYRIFDVIVNDESLEEFTIAASENPNITEYCIDDLSIDKDYNIEVVFALKKYDISITDNETMVNGTVSIEDADRDGVVEHGEDVMVTVSPKDGYTVLSDRGITVKTADTDPVIVDKADVMINADGTCSFEISNVTENKSLDVTFSKADTVEGDYTINSTQASRIEGNTLFVVNDEEKILFETSKDAIRIYKLDQTGNLELIEGSETGQSVEVVGDTDVVKVQVYYQSEDELCFGWHDVVEITEQQPVQVMLDELPASIGEVMTPGASSFGYYNSDVKISITANDATAEEGGKDYSGIASITYFVSNTELSTEAKAENYDAALSEVGVEESVLYSATGDTGIQQQVLKEFTVSITEDNGNNSKDTKVWIKVIDNAGRVTTKIIDLATNITEPTVEVSIDGTKNTDVVGAYYKSDRVFKIKITDRTDTFLATEKADTLQVAIKKNGQDITLNGSDFTWTSNGNVHEGIYIFNEEGRYEIGQISYKNKADKTNEGFSVVDAEGESSSVEKEELSSFVIDKNQPDINAVKIDYPADKYTSSNDNYYYNDFVNVDITAKDNLSGVRYIRWRYIKTEGASNVNKDTQTDWNVVACEEEKQVKDKYECTKTITLPKDGNKQLNGYLEIEIEDWTGHVSQVKAYEDQVFIVDNISPTAEVIYTNQINTVGNVKYYDGNIAFTFKINEANFDAKDVHVFVSKDGAEKVEVAPKWKDETVDLHTGTYTIQGDGDYVLYVNYTDKSGNVMTAYQTELLTVDTTVPEIGFIYDKSAQKMTFTVKEHNFRAQDISVSGSITNINGNAVGFSVEDLQKELRNATWTKEGDIYTYSSDKYIDAIYDLNIDYTDISSNKAKTLKTGAFIIDHTAPTNIKIDYSKSILDTILETITLGFYKGDVTVTFTANDYAAGVESFTWNYTKQNGASDVNRSTDEVPTTVAAVQDTSDKSKFTAKVTLPNTDEKQLRGYLAAYATDTYANAGTKVTDAGRIIVVDSIAPTMTAEYSVADRMVGTTSYYNDLAEVTFTVTEANFFAEDVVVTVSKDGGTAYAITPKWTDVNVDTHVGTYTLTGDGDYVITVNYIDRSTNKMATYVSDTITIDTIQPVVEVVYQNTNVINTLKDRDGMDREYFADTQTAIVTITEHNFNAEDVVFNIKATDVTGEELNVNNLHVKSEWKAGEKADTHVMTITYPGDANYTFDVEYADLATNEIADYAPDYFTVDNTAPVELDLTYSTSILETVLEALSFGFYNAKADVTLTADDAVSGVHGFMYSYENADGVSDVNAELINQAIAASEIEYSNDGMTATVEFEIPKDVLTASNQFNGTISFEATDRAGLKNTLKDNKRIVVDNIAPTAQVTYNEPVNREGTISYYDGNVDATVVVTEANFYAADVVVSVTKDDGAPYVITPSWADNNVDVHTGTFTLNEDGDYFITITYRDKSSNEMVVYTSEQLTIDTDIQEPTITFNGNNEDRMAYKGEIIPEISFTDVNYDSFEIFLYRTYMDAIDVDITEEKGIQNLFTINEETGSASLNVFDLGEDGKYDPNDDGIYRLLVTMQDKAGHTIEKEAYFTINRYGSVYAYDEYLVNLIADGGAYVTTVNEDLVITEYNADRLVTDSLNIEVTRDGKPLDNVEYTVSPNINENVSTGSSGWYQYEYVISKNNFDVDGIYKVYISSKDATGNNPENSNFEDKNILFYVDSTVPEITSITGLENAIVDNTELTISYTVFDAIGLKSIKVYVDDEVLQDVTDFSADFNNYSGSFTLEESEKERSIRIVVEDMAGNITDTASEEFTSAYAFNDGVTVTTNALVRFYANKPLFYGSIGGTAGVAGLAGFGIRRFRLRKKIK